jgi:signal transduction histidine kinase
VSATLRACGRDLSEGGGKTSGRAARFDGSRTARSVATLAATLVAPLIDSFCARWANRRALAPPPGRNALLETGLKTQREAVRHTTHELRDALTIVSGHLELLGDDPEERRDTVALVLDEVDRMAWTVHELQLLTDLQEPDVLRLERLDLAAFVHELVTESSALAPRLWQLDADAAADATLVGDRARLREAVLGLTHNAVRYTKKGDTVAFGASVNEDGVRLWVRDTGRGIPASDQPGILERFVRRSGGYRGGGLGLPVVKAIAEAHGGRVELESRVGAGSKFTIVVPPGRGDVAAEDK